MKTILSTAYAVNPYKGSEDGTGWNIICQMAKHYKVIAITRKNNQAAIDQFRAENDHLNPIEFHYFDLPYWMRFWKRGGRGALLYFYLWQLFVPLFILKKKLSFDIAHALNFHADWMPHFLWLLGKPTIWGPVGHHPRLPKAYFKGKKQWKIRIKDQLKWLMKSYFRYLSPSLFLAKRNSSLIFAINQSTVDVLRVNPEKVRIIPAIGVESKSVQYKSSARFDILSVGRFVPLKGFDISIASFAQFYHSLPKTDQSKVTLKLIGKGPEKNELIHLAEKLKVRRAIEFIDWMPQTELFETFSRAKLFLFPSHEGAGMVVPEALNFGLPVLCFDNAGPGSIVQNNMGVKVPYTHKEESITAFAEALKQLYCDRVKLMRFRNHAQQYVDRHYTWQSKGELINQTIENYFSYEKDNVCSFA